MRPLKAFGPVPPVCTGHAGGFLLGDFPLGDFFQETSKPECRAFIPLDLEGREAAPEESKMGIEPRFSTSKCFLVIQGVSPRGGR